MFQIRMLRESCGSPIPSGNIPDVWELARSYAGTLAWLGLVGAVAENCGDIMPVGRKSFVVWGLLVATL